MKNFLTQNFFLKVNKYQSNLNQYQDFPKHVDLKFPFLGSNIDKGKTQHRNRGIHNNTETDVAT